MSFRAILASAAGLALTAGAAHATLFSFASDNDSSSFTFGGIGSDINDATDSSDPFSLLVDDDGGALPTLSIDAEFDADFSIDHIASVALGGGTFIHNYSLNGTFSFLDGVGAPVLTVEVEGGALTAIGDAASWFTTGVIQGSDNFFGNVTYTWHGADIPEYGLFNGASTDQQDDAGFTLTFLQDKGRGPGTGVQLDQTMLPLSEWTSEGSFSGSAFFIPTPGSVALLGLGVLGLMTRRGR